MRTVFPMVRQHGSGVAGGLDLLAAHAQPGLGSLDPAVHVLAKHLPGQTVCSEIAQPARKVRTRHLRL